MKKEDIVTRLYYNQENLRTVAEAKKISHLALIKRRNKILKKLKELLKDFE